MLIEAFPAGRVVPNDTPGYVNAQYRFNFFLPAAGSGS
jgi:hypothetical protein